MDLVFAFGPAALMICGGLFLAFGFWGALAIIACACLLVIGAFCAVLLLALFSADRP